MHEWTCHEIAQRVRAGDVSAEEVVAHHLDRIEARGELNAQRRYLGAATTTDPGARDAMTLAAEGELNVASEDGIEVSAHEHGGETLDPRSRRHDVARAIDARVTQAERSQPGREPLAAFALVPCRRRDLRHRNLRGDRRRVARRDPRVRRCERTVRSKRSGISAGYCGHE